MKYYLLKLVVLIALLGIGSFHLEVAAEHKPSAIKIGGVFALTGVGASFGDAELKAVQLALDKVNKDGGVNGQPIELVVEDSASSNVGTVSAVTKLATINKLKIIIGPTWLDSFPGVLPIADRSGLLLLTPSAAIKAFKKSGDQYPLIFSLWYSLDSEVQLLLEFFAQKGGKRLALWFDQDPFFQLMADLIVQHASTKGVAIAQRSDFTTGESDFRSKLVQLKEQAPDGIVFGFGGEGSLLTFLKQRRQYYPELKLYGTDYIDGYLGQSEYLPLLEGLHYVAPAGVGGEFKKNYQERFKIEPFLSAPTAYDAISILVLAFKSGLREPGEIASFLRRSEFDTITFGRMKFDALGGVSSSRYEVKLVENGQAKRP